MAATAQLVERLVSDRKVADSRFDSLTGHASLCSWERHFTYIFPFVLISLLVVVAKPDKRDAN